MTACYYFRSCYLCIGINVPILQIHKISVQYIHGVRYIAILCNTYRYIIWHICQINYFVKIHNFIINQIVVLEF